MVGALQGDSDDMCEGAGSVFLPLPVTLPLYLCVYVHS